MHTFHANTPAPLPLDDSPQDCQGSRNAVESACDPALGGPVLLCISDRIHAHDVPMCSTAVCSHHALASPVSGGQHQGVAVCAAALSSRKGPRSTVTATLESRSQCRKSRWQRNSSETELDLHWIFTLEKFFQVKRDSNWKKKKN